MLYCIDSLIRGGTELQLVGLIERLDRTDIQPHILTIRPSDQTLAPKDCEWLNWDVPRLFSLRGFRAMRKLAAILLEQEFDLVHTFFQDSTVLGGAAAWMAGTPNRIASFRDMGFWSTRTQHALMCIAYRAMTSFIANSDAVRQQFAKGFGVKPDKIVVIRNGIDLDALPFVPRTGPVRNIVFVGNMTRSVKRADLFIETAALLRDQYPDIQWHIIGDGHLRGQLEQMANRLHVADRIRFTGRIADVGSELANMDIGVVCSDSEGLSNVLLEYMCRGTVAVATAVGGNPELIRNEISGLLVEPGDASKIAAAIARLIEDPDFRRQLAEAARLILEREYYWPRCLREHLDHYRIQGRRLSGKSRH